jgi:hypothetical protein
MGERAGQIVTHEWSVPKTRQYTISESLVKQARSGLDHILESKELLERLISPMSFFKVAVRNYSDERPAIVGMTSRRFPWPVSAWTS